MRQSVVVALAVGLTAIGIGLIVVPTQSPPVVAGTNSIPGKNYIELEEKIKLSNCQPAGSLPSGTSAVRLGIEGLYFSPAATVRLVTGSHVLTEGQHIAGGPSAPTVTVPVKQLAHVVNGARICTTVGPAFEPIRFYGIPNRTSVSPTNPLQQAVLHMEYIRPGTRSWWSSTSSIAYHMGLGHVPSGTWTVFLVIVLMLAVIAVASRLTLEELR